MSVETRRGRHQKLYCYKGKTIRKFTCGFVVVVVLWLYDPVKELDGGKRDSFISKRKTSIMIVNRDYLQKELLPPIIL